MNDILFWTGVLIAFSLLSPLLKFVIALVAGKQIGAEALSRQPDHIHLERRNAGVWKNAGAVRRLVEPLAARGFADVGVFAIAEMPMVKVQLFANAGDSCYAAVYEHAQAGHWFDLVSFFQDGTSVTYTTSRPTALKPRPGHATVNLPGLDPSSVLDKCLGQRPRRPIQPAAVDQAVAAFEHAYADSMAYRKQAGISTAEVVGTAARKAA